MQKSPNFEMGKLSGYRNEAFDGVIEDVPAPPVHQQAQDSNAAKCTIPVEKSGLFSSGYDSTATLVTKYTDETEPASAVQLSTGKARQQWNNQTEFLLSCIAMSVGLGNIWRFPFTAYENGGGAFLIPYLIVLFTIGKPLYFMELAMGQFSSFGSVKVWTAVPALRGVGYGQMLGSICTVSFYVNLMGVCLLYMFYSFQSILPWTVCDVSWVDCYSAAGKHHQNFANGGNETIISSGNTSSAELFYTKEILHIYPQSIGIDKGLGSPDWRLVLCLFLSWVCVTFTLIKGVQSSGKVAYFSALFPYVVLVTLLIRGATLPGAADGILYFLMPDFAKLADPQVWYAAVTQCFFSLSVGFGTIIMYSSYSPFTHNVYRDAMIISVMDTGTSILAGLSIFAIIGNLAHESGSEIKDVVKSGAGLAFISYPEAIAQFKTAPQVFAVIFFFMLFTLGLGSAASYVGSVITIINDSMPNLKKTHVTLAICTSSFLIGVVYTTPGGQYIQELVDHFGASFLIFILACTETFAMAYIYGVGNFCTDIEFMLGRYPGFYWRLCWYLITPLLLAVILVYSLLKLKSPAVGVYEFHAGPLAAGWILSMIGIAIVPILAGLSYYKRRKEGAKKPLMDIFAHTDEWGPKDPVVRRAWLEFREEKAYRQKYWLGFLPAFPRL